MAPRLEEEENAKSAMQGLQLLKQLTCKKNNEASVTLTVPSGNPYLELLNDHKFASEFFIVSELKVEEGEVLSAVAEATSYPMCPRCRKYEPPVNDEGLCQRCADAVS